MTLLLAALPILGFLALGVLLARLRLLGGQGTGALVAYTYWVGFPALLVHGLGRGPAPGATLALAAGGYAAVMIIVLLAAAATGRLLRADRSTRAGLPMTAAVGNTAFLGAPLAASLLGEDVSAAALAMVACDFVLVMGAALGLLQAGRAGASPRRALPGMLLNPTVAAAALGVWMAAAQARPPQALERPLEWLAMSASPVALTALGALMGAESVAPRKGEIAPLGAALGLKLLVAPLLAWQLLGALGVEPDLRAAATLLAACPTALNVFVQTRSHGVHARGAAQAVVLGTALSALSLPLIAWLVSR